MEDVNLKKACLEVINSKTEVKSIITLVSDGTETSAMIAGTGEELVKMLAAVMTKQPKIRRLVSMAYLATAVQD